MTKFLSFLWLFLALTLMTKLGYNFKHWEYWAIAVLMILYRITGVWD